jgi:hypothetical protein
MARAGQSPAGTIAICARVDGGHDAIGVGVAANAAGGLGVGGTPDGPIELPTLLARGAILGTVAIPEPEGRLTIGLVRTAFGGVAAAAHVRPAGQVHTFGLAGTGDEAGAVIPGRTPIVVQLAVAAAPVASGRVPVVARLRRIDHTITARACRILRLAARTAPVSIHQVSVVAPFREVDDTVAADRLGRYGQARPFDAGVHGWLSAIAVRVTAHDRVGRWAVRVPCAKRAAIVEHTAEWIIVAVLWTIACAERVAIELFRTVIALKSRLIFEATAGRTWPTLHSLRGPDTFDHPTPVVPRSVRVVFGETRNALRTAAVAVHGVPVVTELGSRHSPAPIVHDPVPARRSVAGDSPRVALATSRNTRIQSGQDAIGVGMTENLGEKTSGTGTGLVVIKPHGLHGTADVLVLRPALFAVGAVFWTITGLEVEG